MKMATVTSSNEDIFSIAGQHTTASRFKLKSNTDDEIYSSRVNHSVAYSKCIYFFKIHLNVQDKNFFLLLK